MDPLEAVLWFESRGALVIRIGSKN